MPILFFIDPKISEDKYLKNLSELTLSYSFFKAKTNNDDGDGVTVESLTQERREKGLE